MEKQESNTEKENGKFKISRNQNQNRKELGIRNLP